MRLVSKPVEQRFLLPSANITFIRHAHRVGQDLSWWQVCPAAKLAGQLLAGLPPADSFQSFTDLVKVSGSPTAPSMVSGEQLAPWGRSCGCHPLHAHDVS